MAEKTEAPLTDAALRRVFAGAGDFCARPVEAAGRQATLYFIDGLTSGDAIAEQVLRPLSECPPGAELRSAVWSATAEPCAELQDALNKLVNGFCVLLTQDGEALACEVKTGEKRGVSEPETESTAKGPRDAFTETVRTNTSLLRRHLRAPELRLYEAAVGTKSRTNVCVASLEGVTDPVLVRRMIERLERIDADGLTTPAAVEEYVTGSRKTPFPLLQHTERTDRFADGLLSGRVGLFVDGLPLGWLAPAELGGLMEAAEDRDTDYVSASLVRVLRYAALLISVLLPGLYVAMAGFHQQMLPTKLLFAIIESKQSVPFPTVLEVLGLLLSFELLQEAGLASPKAVSQPISIIGGLVVGTAAVEAKLISPAALIVVAAAGICGFAIPGKGLADAARLCRLALTLAASLAGLYGMTLASLALLTHLASLESFGQPYLAPFSSLRGAKSLLRGRLKEQTPRG